MAMPSEPVDSGSIANTWRPASVRFVGEERTGDRHRAAPLAGAGLGRDLGDALHLVVVRLRDGGVGLVRTTGADALVLVEDLDPCGEPEDALELTGAQHRRRAVG